MVKLNITTLEDIKVACVKSVTFPSGVKDAFEKLESSMETLKGLCIYFNGMQLRHYIQTENYID